MRKTLIAVFYLVAAVVIGALVAAATAQIGKSIGIPADSPAVLDLSVIKLAFGFEVGVTVAHILCFIGAFAGYKYTVKRMRLGERDEYEKGE